MKKTVLVSGLLTVSFLGYKALKKHIHYPHFHFYLLKTKCENSGYILQKTKHKGVFTLEKDQKSYLLIYDNSHFSNDFLVNQLNEHRNSFHTEIYLLSNTPNTLYGKTKPHFFRWASAHLDKPLTVHFSTLQHVLKEDEVTWETTKL